VRRVEKVLRIILSFYKTLLVLFPTGRGASKKNNGQSRDLHVTYEAAFDHF
jgi:hypothetical protein